MELTQELKDLLNAHNMASITDFVNEELVDYYADSIDLSKDEITRISKEYDGNGMDRLEDCIIGILKRLNND